MLALMDPPWERFGPLLGVPWVAWGSFGGRFVPRGVPDAKMGPQNGGKVRFSTKLLSVLGYFLQDGLFL